LRPPPRLLLRSCVPQPVRCAAPLPTTNARANKQATAHTALFAASDGYVNGGLCLILLVALPSPAVRLLARFAALPDSSPLVPKVVLA
jgi:hypothetical protein